MFAQRIALAMAAVLGMGALPAAHGQGVDTGGIRLRPILGIGYTWGGDTIADVVVTESGSSQKVYDSDIDAGAGLDLRAGVDISWAGSPLSLQLAAAYHVDGFGGTGNTGGEFRRIPVEAVLRWRAADRIQVGFGVRKAAYASLRVTDASCSGPCGGGRRVRYSGSPGIVLEAEYAISPDWGLRARYVWEDYEITKQQAPLPTPPWATKGFKVNADHFGLMSVWYFR